MKLHIISCLVDSNRPKCMVKEKDENDGYIESYPVHIG